MQITVVAAANFFGPLNIFPAQTGLLAYGFERHRWTSATHLVGSISHIFLSTYWTSCCVIYLAGILADGRALAYIVVCPTYLESLHAT